MTSAFDPSNNKYVFSQNGVTKILDEVSLDLHIPEGFDLSKISKLTDYADLNGIPVKISTIESRL